ncbi:MAG: DUF4838 domain-containing protein [Clostridia bacterium]|nr:DUF4838 domain-containing protein [Clostridia bacterium]
MIITDNSKRYIVRDGASDYVISLCPDASPSEKFAAGELSKYIEKISGCVLPVISGGKSADSIFVGSDSDAEISDLGDDGFVISSSVSGGIRIAGGRKRGTLYGVYAFLEDFLGCRFLSDEAEIVPETKDVAVPLAFEKKEVPVIRYRDTYCTGFFADDIAAKRRFNGGEHAGMDEEHGGAITWTDGLYCHTIFHLSGEDKPAFTTPTPCLTDDRTFETVLENVRKAIKKDPKGSIISISQADNSNHCGCPKCRALEEREGCDGATVFAFANRIAEAIEDEYPDIRIETMAYQFSLDPPKTIRPRKNVIIRVISLLSCFSHPLEDCSVEYYEERLNQKNKHSFAENLRAWSKLCDKIHIWDYITNFDHYPAPFPNLNVIRRNIRFFAENNVDGVFEQGVGNSKSGKFDELRGYLVSKCLWDPFMSEEEYDRHINEFLEGFYGPGWKYLREYIDLAHGLTRDVHFHIYADPTDVIPPRYVKNGNPLPPPTEISPRTDWLAYADNDFKTDTSFIEKAEKLFETAADLADTAERRARVERAAVQVLYYKIYFTFVRYGKRLEEALKAIVPEADLDSALKYAHEQKDEVVSLLNRELQMKLRRFDIERIAEDMPFPLEDGKINYKNEPKMYWDENTLTLR